MKVKCLGHYNSPPFLCLQYNELFDMEITHSQDEGRSRVSGIKSMIYPFSVPCCKWLLRGETGLMNGFCLPLYYFFLFLNRSQFDCDLLKGKVKYHRAENQLPRASTASLQCGSYSDFYHVFASGVLMACKHSSSMWLECHWEVVPLLRTQCGLLRGPWSRSTSVQGSTY